ncbi:DMT family transporter [Bdellovibrio sp. HCB337]|uniref:DMT family transporter n=1 Tax=Bdellovibrio sp. HCB337 TaxID=3394358 RepID=UPI0039A4CDCD
MSFANPTPRQAVFELIFAGALWGFGFVATQWALTTWNPVGVLFWRFAGALFLGEILYLIFARTQKTPDGWKEDFKGSIPAGLLLGSFLLLQTIGLQYTTASKSGFITTLYVVFVPIANWLIFKKRLSFAMLTMVGGALMGTFLLMGTGLETFTQQINIGDLWTLGSAALGAAHIIYIGRFTQKMKNPFRVNNFQSLWSLVAIFPFAFFMSDLQVGPINSKALWGIAIIAAACSVLAFYIQVRAQKVLSDTTASMLFLLESPYAFIFAYLLMGDRLTGVQSLGALLILGAALGMVLLESGSTSKTQSE